MPNTYSATGSATYSTTFDSLDQMMAALPDNNSNLIDPKDLRDATFTLWDRIDTISFTVSLIGSVSSDYIRSTPTPISVGGVSIGTTFSGSVQDALDRILYPYVGPSCTLSGGGNREFGSTTSTTLTWTTTQNTNPIIAITVSGVGTTYSSGSMGAFATQNVNTTFNMSVYDGVSNAGASTTVTWLNARYWGISTTFGGLTSSQINGLTGAGVGVGKELSTTRVQSRNGINGGGNYLVFAWPSSFGTPTFVINGLPSSAWTKVNNATTFTNIYGYTASYDVWMSNTQQYSPISTFSIT